MKKIALSISCFLLMAGLTFGQTQAIALFTTGTFNTSGTFNSTSAFSLDTSITFSGYTAEGLSYWLEVPTALAPFISITSETYFTFTDPTNGGVKTFADSAGADPGFLADRAATTSGDLGATNAPGSGVPAGMYKVSTLNFSLSGAPPGTYSIRTTTLTPRISEVSDSAFVPHNLPQATYTITVVPEPATWSLMGLGGLGAIGLTWLRARRRK